MARVLLAGESWISTTTEYKGFDSFTFTKLEIGCNEFLDALRSSGHTVTHMCAHDVPLHFPSTREELSQFDVVILSDIGSNSFLLPPQVFDTGEKTTNRLSLLSDWVKEGNSLFMAGGYLSFSGFEGKAHYHGTEIESILPVSILPYDDRVECPQGIQPQVIGEHPVTSFLTSKKIDTFPIPHLLGYQKLLPKEEAEILMSIKNDPLLVLGNYGKGRTAAFASDISPHWASKEFMEWDGYSLLFSSLISWLAKE